MKKIYYEKVGKKFVPVKEYDVELMDSLPKGNHLLMIHLNGSSCRYNINPLHAPLIAAARSTEDVLANAIVKASEINLSYKDRNRTLTEEQKEAWDNLVRVFGDSARYLEIPSAREIAEEGIQHLITEALNLLNNPIAKKAFEEFLMVVELSK